MPALSFRVVRADVVPFAASSSIAFTLRVINANSTEAIHSAVLRARVRIDVARRGAGMQRQLWSEATAVVPAFVGETEFSMVVPATVDFSTAVTRYLAERRGALIPLAFVFSGSVFYETEPGVVGVAPIEWKSGSEFALPIETWRSLMDGYYPNAAWLSVRRDVYNRLDAYKSSHGIRSWDDVLDTLLGAEESAVSR